MAEPPTAGGGKPEPWRVFYGYSRTLALLYDQWDLAAAAATSKGKPPKHPGRPGAKPAGVPLSKMVPRRTTSRDAP